MRRIPLVTLAMLLALPCTAAAHLLDEYLQAARIAVARDRVAIEIDLSPGVAVASKVLTLIDRNGDGEITPPEIEVYAQSVLRDVAIEIDGRASALTLTRAECPTPAELREGVGRIRLEAATAVSLDPGRHRIRFENGHQSAIGVYLVNALVPASRAIAITAQRRDVRQHGIELDVDVAGPKAARSWLLFGSIGLTALVAYRRRG